MPAGGDMVYVYVARQRYRSTKNNDPDMETNDVIHITADTLLRQNIAPDALDGWIAGVNVRTGQEGYFPGYLLVLNGSQARAAVPRTRPPIPPDMKPPYHEKQQVYEHMTMRSLSISDEASHQPHYGECL
ncbi:hypothetical protein Pmani_039581 [Petrolisthes manimaculis]|uniref:SH3 domain-containing protein n=1 Tax=Petrolisthes manimaculis TaxID=1843537 RepID=A0AAE1TJF2_9EUCA|nr:hypothetical protein Pmani_039581 [Petrolisthes manimaculis]